MPTGRNLPPLFNFSIEGSFRIWRFDSLIINGYSIELSIQPELIKKLVPPHCYEELASKGINILDIT